MKDRTLTNRIFCFLTIGSLLWSCCTEFGEKFEIQCNGDSIQGFELAYSESTFPIESLRVDIETRTSGGNESLSHLYNSVLSISHSASSDRLLEKLVLDHNTKPHFDRSVFLRRLLI